MVGTGDASTIPPERVPEGSISSPSEGSSTGSLKGPSGGSGGGTFTRRGRKERQGLYFITGEPENVHLPHEMEEAEEGLPSEDTGSEQQPGGNPPQPSTKALRAQPPQPISRVIVSDCCEEEGVMGALGHAHKLDVNRNSRELSSLHGNINSNNSNGRPCNEENFECFGEGNDHSFTSTCNESAIDLPEFGQLNESEFLSPESSTPGNRLSLSRSGWQRTSLRRTPNSGGGKRVASSSALASHLYRSSSYHSSGRSSAGDNEEIFSDSSLEGEVSDLSKKVERLEEKYSVLAESQCEVDERYARAKSENAELSTRLFILEEQLRESEQRLDEKVREEQRRYKELLARMERERQLVVENYEIKLQMMEKDLNSFKNEARRLEGSLETERNEKNQLSDKCLSWEREISNLRDHNRELLNQNRQDRENMAMESAGSQQALAELKRQLDNLSHFHLKGSAPGQRREEAGDLELELLSRLKESQEDNKKLKKANKELQEAYDELSAQILNQGLEDGRALLSNLNCTAPPAQAHSLAAEFEAMTAEQFSTVGGSVDAASEELAGSDNGRDWNKMKSALKDQQEANLALRSYIDGILLNIVEHYPQLLEVKQSSSRNNET